MERLHKTIIKFEIPILILVLSIPALIPLLRGDFFHFSDEPQIANLYQMIRAIGSGQIPPRWAPDMSFGYGYPLFTFYYPLPFYLGTLFYFFTGSLVVSLKLLFAITVPLSGLFMYKWLRLHTNKFNSLIGVLVYTYTPYRAVDLYVRGALGELFSFIFFPLTAYFAYLVMKKGLLRDVGMLAIAISLFVLSHNLAPLFFIPWVGVYTLVSFLKGNSINNLFKVVAGFLLGLLGSAYFWLPALIEKVNLVGNTPFNYLDHFPFIKQLILPSWGYGASHPGIYDDISFQIGVPNLALIVALVLVIYKGREKLKSLIFPLYFLASIAFIVFLMNIRSAPLWELSTLATYIQFPWRLLLLTTFLTSSLVIFINYKKFIPRVFLVIIAFISIFGSQTYFKPSEYFETNDEYYLSRFFADRTSSGARGELSLDYLNYSEDYLLLPLWTKERPSILPDEKIFSSDVEVFDVDEISSVEHFAKVKTQEGGKVSVAVYYYPGWKVEVDGVERSIDIEQPNGNISFGVFPGDSNIRVYWSETPLRKASNYLSVTGFAVFLYLVFGNKAKRLLKENSA
jgi:hypothetical protein